MDYKGYRIRKSGKYYYRIYKDGKATFMPRVSSIEAAQACILSQGRVMTRKEHQLVHGGDFRTIPTLAQAESESLVASGKVEGFI